VRHGATRIASVCALAFAVAVFAGCERKYKPKPVTELAGRFKIVNIHEHIQSRKVAPKLLRVMDELSIARTVLVGSSKKTSHHIKHGFIGYDDNNEELLTIARMWPDRFIPFVTLNPKDPDNVERLERWVKKGAKGLKLYSGHGMFYDLPLDDPGMMAVYKWCEAKKLHLCWHVNLSKPKYLEEFLRVMDQVPNLYVNVPHHCMSTTKPERMRMLFEKYPNLYTDISHGTPQFMADALRRITRNADVFRGIYEEFSDRFTWGSDTVVTPHPKKTDKWLKTMFGMYFGLLGDKSFKLYTFDKKYRPTGHQMLEGLDLPVELQRKILQTNAERLLGLKPL